MKNFTSPEQTKAMESIIKRIEESKRRYPIDFELHGRTSTPVLIKPNYDNLSDDKKKNSKKKVSVNVGSEDKGAFIKAEITIEKQHFVDSDQKDAFIEVPVLPISDPLELMKTTKAITEILVALRNSVMMVTATNPLFVQNSTVEPPTGVILADILGETSRLRVEQKATVKDIIENSENLDGSKLTAFISEYNANKQSSNLIEQIGYITLVKLAEGLGDLIKEYPKLQAKGYDDEVVTRAADAAPVVVSRKETKMTEVERREVATKKFKSLI